MTDEQLSALLRIKRHEQPPAEYFERLLRDVQRRQRTELLRRPLWKIALERLQTFFGEHSMGQISYAGSMAAMLVIGLGAIGLLTPGVERKGEASAPSTQRLLTLQTSERPPALAPALRDHPAFEPAGHAPRYVIDTRPASYEPSSSFNF